MRHLRYPVLLALVGVGLVVPATSQAAPAPEQAPITIRTVDTEDTLDFPADPPVLGKGGTYPTYSYRGCWSFYREANDDTGVACFKMWVKKQEDGSGVVNKTRRIGVWTNDHGAISSTCGSAYNNPCTKSSSVVVRYDGVNRWGPVDGTLTDGGGGFYQWSTDVKNAYTTGEWVMRPDINGGLDGGDRKVTITVRQDGSWSCTVPRNAAQNCERQGPF